MFQHHELPQDEVRRRQQQQHIDRLQRMLQTTDDDALRTELLAALDDLAGIPVHIVEDDEVA